MKKLMPAVFCLALVVCGSSAFAGTEYFADAKNGNDAWDGSSPTHVKDTNKGPKLTIQAAVDLAQVDSTAADRNIVTLAPGDYTNGVRGVTSDGVVSSNRVVITAPIRLRSSGGRATRDTTRIIGQWDLSGEADTKYYMGPRRPGLRQLPRDRDGRRRLDDRARRFDGRRGARGQLGRFQPRRAFGRNRARIHLHAGSRRERGPGDARRVQHPGWLHGHRSVSVEHERRAGVNRLPKIC